MADIKVKKSKKGTIKTLNKAIVGTEKIKNEVVQTKNKIKKETNQEENTSSTDYAIDKITDIPNNLKTINNYGKEKYIETKENINEVKKKIINNKKINDIDKIDINNSNKIKNSIKTEKQTNKNVIKTIDRKEIKGTKKKVIEISNKAMQLAKETVSKTTKNIKETVENSISALKAIIKGTKALITALIASGWIIIIIIILICMVAMICSSVFGIFFSNEPGIGNKTMSSVISELNVEFNNKLMEIQNTNPHDDFEINSDRVKWKDIISIYAAIVTGGEEQADVITLDDNKIEKLKNIFWEMNIINYHVEDVEKDVEIINDDGTTTIEKQIRKTLYIDIENVPIEEITKKYNFNKNQIKQLAELRKEEYDHLWSNVLYGSTTGSTDIVEVARSQLGNVGGQPYWSWYGFNSRVSWCACFVSWCADQCGYIQSGVIPKFASCQLEGVNWFKACGLWQDGGYIPKSGDIIFFDWNEKHDGHSDHVGIVEKVENGRVYTIEGNSNNACKERNYDINSNEIQGYGTPMY